MSGHIQYSSVDSGPIENKPTPSTVPGTMKITPLLQPLALLLLGVLLAIGHHSFNKHADGRLVDPGSKSIYSQVWMNRIGTAFAFGFKAALSTSLGFVLCQLMWLTLRRKFLTLPEIDNAYLTANQNVMATFFSSSVLKSPLLVIAVAVSFLLPIPTIFTPSSLRVVSRPVFEPSTPCSVPTGNLTNGGPGSRMYETGGWGYWTGVTPVAQKLATSTFIGQKIVSLPQTCGLNCTYSVSLPSIAFQCKNGVELPAGMSKEWPNQNHIGEETFWNVTANSTYEAPSDAFYVYWKSSTQSGTNGTAVCTVATVQYNFTISFRNGQQLVSYSVSYTGVLNDATSSYGASLPQNEYTTILQLSSLSAATRALLLGSLSVLHGASGNTPKLHSSVISAAFFDPSLNSGIEFSWGDVPRGIEQLSHNVSAAILSMNLGFKDSSCAISKVFIVYEYDRLNLLLPYGASLLVISLCLALGITTFFRLNPENLTTSFSDIVSVTRNPSLTVVHYDQDSTESKRLKFRLGELENGDKGFGMRGELKEE